MGKSSYLDELKKKLKERATLWLSALIILILADEYIKEGYLFRFTDIYSLELTHEKLILICAIPLIYLIIKRFSKTKTPLWDDVYIT